VASAKRSPSTKRPPRSVTRTAPPAERALLRAAGREAHPEFELRDDVVERALRTGEHQGLLEDYFGPEQYAELRQLSREVTARGVRGGPKVLILPGIMGSKIGLPHPIQLLDDVIWFDPVDIATGKLTRLALGGSASRFGAVGVILLAYLRLKLRLVASGYDAEFYPYDWRQSIAALGGGLARRLSELGGKVDLVAHSMGGLVARSAIGQGARCHRLIMLGTPNAGSFAPVMALRGTYPVVRKAGSLDLFHTPEQLAREVFSTFPGLTEMLPAPGSFSAVDLYDLNSWPADGLRPRKPILDRVAKVRAGFAPGADNFHLVAGVEQQTAVGLTAGAKEFVYSYSLAGDGTVPLDFARLPGIKSTYYVAESHGSLPNNRLVCTAVIDLLAKGETTALPDTYVPATRAAPVEQVPERALRTPMYEGRAGGMLSQSELRHLTDEVASPEARDTAAAAPVAGATSTEAASPLEAGYRHAFEHIVVGRRRQHRIDLHFALGSITEVSARALALGVFRGVTPTGAAAALDRRMSGAVTELSRRRMFSGQVGEIFILPTGRHPLAADLIAFVGLGDFDRFGPDVLQTAAENIARTLVSARMEEFATVLFGGGSGEAPASALRNLLIGFFRGLQDADSDHQFRRLVLCEQNADRFVQLKEELYRLSSTDVCGDVELTFDEIVLPSPAEPAADATRAMQTAPAPVYLIVRQERGSSGSETLVRSSLLTAGAKATVVGGTSTVKRAEFDSLRSKATSDATQDLEEVGIELGELLLGEEVRTVMPRFSDRHLVVVHDAAMSQVPWEVIAFRGGNGKGETWFPAAKKGLSHRYQAEKLSVAKWLEQRLDDNVLTVLLVVNPTEDLEGAEEEGERIRTRFQKEPSIQLDEIAHEAATRPALLAAFTSGKYDVIHYAGHAAFDELHPGQSGLVCAGGGRLTGADLAGLSRLPSVVFFNACEAGRVRLAATPSRLTRKDTAARSRLRLRHLRESVGLAEAFMLGGVANFLGTYWPVGDAAALTFSDKLYEGLLRGETIGSAIQAGRGAVRRRSKDWANYVFYGDPEFVLKRS
jgi:pimeloyl-ACP methyl ester carboxylesterase